jgi:hypothetical protein
MSMFENGLLKHAPRDSPGRIALTEGMKHTTCSSTCRVRHTVSAKGLPLGAADRVAERDASEERRRVARARGARRPDRRWQRDGAPEAQAGPDSADRSLRSINSLG